MTRSSNMPAAVKSVGIVIACGAHRARSTPPLPPPPSCAHLVKGHVHGTQQSCIHPISGREGGAYLEKSTVLNVGFIFCILVVSRLITRMRTRDQATETVPGKNARGVRQLFWFFCSMELGGPYFFRILKREYGGCGL